MLKQITVLFIIFYYIFQLLHPKGFCISFVKYKIRLYKLQKEIRDLKNKSEYLRNTAKAIDENKEDTIEELMIKNTGKQVSQKNYIYVKSSD